MSGLTRSTRSARPSWKCRQLSTPGWSTWAGWSACFMVMTRWPRRTSSLARATVRVVFPAFFRPMMEMIRSPPQLFRARQVVRGVHVEEQELRVAEAGDLGQGEDTDADALMEGDGPEIAPVEALRDGVAAGRTVAGAERLQAPRGRRSAAGRRRALARPSPSRRSSPSETKGMSQATQTTGAGVSTTAV